MIKIIISFFFRNLATSNKAKHINPKISFMDLKELQEFIRNVAKSGISEVEIEMNDHRLVIKTPTKGKNIEQQFAQQMQMQMAAAPAVSTVAVAGQPVAQTPAPAANAPVETKAENANLVTFRAPMVGTFYRRPTPDKPFFVTVGDQIQKGKVFCIIEAMKLFNEIEAEYNGRIVQILVEDATPVEFDQPLFLIDISGN